MNTPGTEVKRFDINVEAGAKPFLSQVNVTRARAERARHRTCAGLSMSTEEARDSRTCCFLYLSLSVCFSATHAAAVHPGLLGRWFPRADGRRLLRRREEQERRGQQPKGRTGRAALKIDGGQS